MTIEYLVLLYPIKNDMLILMSFALQVITAKQRLATYLSQPAINDIILHMFITTLKNHDWHYDTKAKKII